MHEGKRKKNQNSKEELKKEVRENSKQIGEAADFGDLKENGEYKAAKEIQAMLFSKLERLQPYLAAIIIEKKEISTEVVSFGTTVKLKDLVTQKVVSYTFVGPVEYELEIYPSIVTFTSPLGKALVGKKKGESDDRIWFSVLSQLLGLLGSGSLKKGILGSNP